MGLLLKIGGLIQKIIDKHASPVEVPPEEMERARKHIEECIALDQKRKEGENVNGNTSK